MPVQIHTLRANDDSAAAAIFAQYSQDQPDFDAAHRAQFGAIEGAISATQQLGRLPLWEEYTKLNGYGRNMGPTPKRAMNDVRTKGNFCRFYAYLAATLAPAAIIEVGAAFGASGMYWLAGLKTAKSGTLYSSEPNPEWHPIAQENFDLVSDRNCLTLGTFEDNVSVVEAPAQIALIDAIHTGDFVRQQFDLIQKIAAPGALVLFDDINFSDDMKTCWAEIADSSDWTGVWTLGRRVGVVELR
ncbi:O-methyltransferase [Pseudooctadecabacter sp.]|uniref:O-methyltransferase n=1 Tax=Pseudooctadecabacter sp. TaxID=1966338 RepID=UPI0035C80DD3